jgi:hypothetical protein
VDHRIPHAHAPDTRTKRLNTPKEIPVKQNKKTFTQRISEFIARYGFGLTIACFFLILLAILNPWRKPPLQEGELVRFQYEGVIADFTVTEILPSDSKLYGTLHILIPAGSTVLNINSHRCGVAVGYIDAQSQSREYRWGPLPNPARCWKYKNFYLYLDLYRNDSILVEVTR